MNATWKSWLHRLMNRGTGAVRALGFTTRRPSRMLRMPRMRMALGALALSGALGTTAWGQAPEGEGVVKLGGGAATVSQAQGTVGLSDPSASMSAAPAMMAQAPMAPMVPQQQYVAPYNPYQAAPPRVADRTWQNYEQGQGVGYAAAQDVTQILYRAQHTSGKIYGADQGYTSLNAFIPLGNSGGDALWYIQPRANVTNDGAGMANVGVGYRFYTPDDDRVWSSTFWWDGDGGHHTWYNQLGAHFSSVGKYLSWRGGFALPVGSTNDAWGRQVSDIFFIDDGIGFNVASRFETAYQRYDIEAATPIPYFGRYGWEVGVGMYYLNAPDADESLGVSARVEAQVTEDFWINTLVTSDEIFGGNVSLNMELTLPDGAPSRWFRPKRVRDALTASDKRNYRVAAHTKTVMTQERAIDPQDGQPIRVAHINPNLVAPGDGTVQSPFQSVFEFDSLDDLTQGTYDIIFVRRRIDGTDTNLNTTVTLFDGQRLLGDGTLPLNGRHTFQALVNGNLGTFVLPDQTAGALPLLSNSGAPGQDVITLANGNEVSGFIIDGTNTAAAIRGTNINGFNINSIGTTRAVDGVVITSDTSVPNGLPLDGIGIIANNLGYDLNGNGTIDPAEDTNNNGILDAGEDTDGDGILDPAELPTEVPVYAAVQGIEGAGFGSNRGVSITQVNGNLDLVVRNNFIGQFLGEDRNNNGLLDPSEDLNLNGVLDPGEDLNANGILDLAEDTNGNAVLDRGVGLEVIADNGSTINANGTALPAGIDPFVTTATPGTTGIVGNTIDGNGFGASLQALNGATFNADVTNNIIRNSVTAAASEGAGIEIISDAGIVNLETFQSNRIYSNAFRGANVVAQNGGLITIDDGVDGTAALSGNLISDNGDDGMRIVADSGSVVIDQIANNIFGSEDLDLDGVFDSGEDLNLNGVLDGGNGGNGLALEVFNNGVITVGDPITGNRFNGNGEDGLAVNAESGTIAIDIGENNQFSDNGDDGASFTVGPGGFISTNLQSIVATGNAGAGVEVLINGGVVEFADIRNNVFDENEIGLAIINNDGGTFTTPTIANNSFDNNNRAGLLIGGDGGAATATTDLGTIINNTFNRETDGFFGIEFDTLDVQVNAVARQNTFIGRGAASGPGIGGVVGGTGGLNLDLAPNQAANGNLFRDNGDAHIGIILEGQTQNVVNIANHVFDSAVDSTDLAFQSNFFGGDGVAFVLRQESSLTGGVSSSAFTDNQGDGLRLEIFSQSLTGFATLNNFTIGGPTVAQGNLFDGNLDDGIHVSRTGSGHVNNVVIQNNLIQNTGISADPNLDRQVNGSATSTADGGQITEVVDVNNGETTGSPFFTQGDDGLFIFARGLNTQDSYTILDNVITQNSDNAVHIKTSGEASISIEMRRNTLDDNEGNGLAITEESAFIVGDTHYLTGVIAGNTFRNNEFNGIYEAAPTDGLQVGEAGAAFSNLITGNGLNGVAITGIDSPQNAEGSALPFLQNAYSTRYLNNLVANNTGAGNQITTGGTVTSLNRTSINSAEQAGHGFDIDTAVDKVIRIEDNEIRNNAHDGIEFQNGNRTNIGGDGRLGTSVLQVVNNLIEFNGDRGIDILNKVRGTSAADSIIVIEDNNISNNDEEGVYIVNTNSVNQRQNVSSSVNLEEDGGILPAVFMQVTMRGNEILGNGVNVDQTPAGLAPGGPIRASGLVLRVGTSGGGHSIFETGGFATVLHQSSPDTGYPIPLIDTQGIFEEDFNSNGVLDAGEDLNGDGILNSTEIDRNNNGLFDPSEDVNGNGIQDVVGLVNAGILMEMTNNTFAGNFGDDIFIHSFRSTADPAASGGTWSANDFAPNATTFQNGDPLARLDLIYGNNSFISAELTPRTIVPHPGTTDSEPGAYYNNSDDFKSRNFTPNDVTSGPFAQNGGNTRRRNAQRLSDRVYASGTSLPPGPGQPEGGNLVMYSGMGDSTFRVRGALDLDPTNFADTNAYLAALSAEGFVMDDFQFNVVDPPGSPIEDLFEVNGTPFNPGTQFGELPFGWGNW